MLHNWKAWWRGCSTLMRISLARKLIALSTKFIGFAVWIAPEVTGHRRDHGV